MPEDELTLAIWFRNGETAYFTGVEDFGSFSSTIEFRYFGKETQITRDAVFNRNVIAGFAISHAD